MSSELLPAGRRRRRSSLRRPFDLHEAAGRGKRRGARHRARRHTVGRRHDQPRRRAPRSARDPQPVEPDAPCPSCLRNRAVQHRQRRRCRRSSRSIRSTCMDGLKRIEDGIAAIVAAGAIPLAAGGDHLTTLPVLRAVARDAPVGMIHFDAHSDTNDRYFGDNPLYARHALPPRHRRGPARPEAHRPDRHPRLDLRARRA